MVARIQDWPTSFAAFLSRKSREPFAWGTNDCVMFAADAVLAITGDDPCAKFRGKYKTAKGAATLMRKHGGLSSAVHAAVDALGFQKVSPFFAQRGDIALAETINGLTVIVRASNDWVGPGADGSERVLTLPLAAWAVARSS